MKPPIETHRPRMNDRQVRYLTGLSSRVRLSFSAEVESARAGVAACEEKGDSFAGLILSIKEETPILIVFTVVDGENKKMESQGKGRLNSEIQSRQRTCRFVPSGYHGQKKWGPGSRNPRFLVEGKFQFQYSMGKFPSAMYSVFACF